MAITTYAAIDVGSDELALKIFEISKAKGIVELTHLRHKLSLGNEVFAHGHISYKTMSEICRVLKDFKEIMREYETTLYHAYGTEALREASNKLVLLDQVKLQADIKIRILSNSEERFLYYKTIYFKEKHFHDMIEEGALIVNMQTGSVQLSLIENGTLSLTQNLKLGPVRIHELLHTMESQIFDFNDLISEYMDKDLTEFFRIYVQAQKIPHIIAVGAKMPEIRTRIQDKYEQFTGLLSRKEFLKVNPEGHISLPQSELIISTLLLFRKMITLTKCNDIYLSSVDLCDCMVTEFAERKFRLSSGHDFTQDIISTSKNMARRYEVNMEHVDNVSYLANEIFDSIRKLHGLGKRERLLLQIAVILHSCGAYVNMSQTRENSYKIIMSTEIIGISHRERVMVANIVRYNSEQFPPYEKIEDEISREEYITVVKLCAILKLANVMDKSNTQKIKKVRVTLKENSLLIVAHTLADITLEKGLFYRKADVFEEVFGIRPVLKKRK